MTIRAYYQKMRADHPYIRASQAILWARSLRKAEGRTSIPEPYGEPVVWEQGRIRVTSWIEIDDDPDLSHYGEWTDKQGEFVWDEWVPSLMRASHLVERNAYTRFLPTNPDHGHLDMAHMEDFGQTWGMFGVILTITVNVFGKWVEIARASLWGIDLSERHADRLTTKMYVSDVISDLRGEAFLEARTTIETENAR